MFDFFLNILFTFLVFSNLIGCGYLVKLILKKKISNLTYLFIIGTSFSIIVSIFINYFFPLNYIITNSLFILFTIFGLIKLYKKIIIFENIGFISFVVFFSSLIIFKSYPNSDYEYYHLPYIEIIRNYKIIFGLSNFEFSAGYASIFQNISAIQYNSLMKLDSFVYFTSILTTIIIAEILFKYLKSDIVIIKFISFIFIFNFLIHANRYGSLGNDFPAHALSFFSYILFFSLLYENKNNNKLFIFLLCIIIAIFGKLTLAINALLIIPIFLTKKYNYIDYKTLIFILLIPLSIFAKNFINTSCFIYPISKTCIQTNWLPDEYDFSNASKVHIWMKALNMGYKENNIFFDKNNIIKNSIENKKDIYSKLNNHQKIIFENNSVYNNFTNLKQWIFNINSNNEFKDHFKRKIFNDLILFMLINIIFFFLYNNNYKLINLSKKKFDKYELFFFLFLGLSTITWFVSGPILRYGLSFLYLFFNIPFYLFIANYSKSFQKIDYYFKFMISLALIFSLTENIIRIKNFDVRKNYTNNIVPLKIIEFKKIHYKQLILNHPIDERKLGRICSYTKPLCVSHDEFLESNFNISKTRNYLFIKKNKN